MAVYEGARRPGIAFPWFRPGLGGQGDGEPAVGRRASGGTRAHRARRTSGHASARSLRRARQRPRIVGGLLAGIVIVFSGAFLSLSQSVRVAATSYDLSRLVSEQDRLSALQLDLRSNVDRLGSEPAIRKVALDSGLGQLGPALVLAPR